MSHYMIRSICSLFAAIILSACCNGSCWPTGAVASGNPGNEVRQVVFYNASDARLWVRHAEGNLNSFVPCEQRVFDGVIDTKAVLTVNLPPAGRIVVYYFYFNGDDQCIDHNLKTSVPLVQSTTAGQTININ